MHKRENMQIFSQFYPKIRNICIFSFCFNSYNCPLQFEVIVYLSHLILKKLKTLSKHYIAVIIVIGGDQVLTEEFILDLFYVNAPVQHIQAI